MGYISNKDGSYYEGDLQYGDLEVPNRPSSNHEYVNGEWVLKAPDQTILGKENHKAMIRRRASKLIPIEAVLLLKTIGE